MAFFSSVHSQEFIQAFLTQSMSFVVMLFCVLLFARSLKRRPSFYFRLCAGLLIAMSVFACVAVLRMQFPSLVTRIFGNLISYFIALPLLILCYKDTWVNILLTWCAGVAAQEIAARCFSLLLSAIGVNSQECISLFPESYLPRDAMIMYVSNFLMGYLAYRAFRTNKCIDADGASMRTTTSLSVFSALWLAFSNSITREFQSESDILYQFLMVSALVFAGFVLYLRTGILVQSEYRHEITLMEQILHQERKQYQNAKENRDIINMMYHDLKHQLSNFSAKLTAQEIRSIQQAINIYDSNIKTGNEVLDVLLYEKQIICQKEGIILTCMADGKTLSFMRTTHIYALFNNALENALEAVRKLDNPEMRVVDLAVTPNANTVEILVSNYFRGELFLQDGLPLATTKDDKNRHGFGTLSMKYVAELYGGALSVAVKDSIFTLNISIPIPK